MAMWRPAEVFQPGEFLAEELEERGWSQEVLAEITGLDAVFIAGIVEGKQGITPETARALAFAFGDFVEYWMNLDAAYERWRRNANGAKPRQRGA